MATVSESRCGTAPCCWQDCAIWRFSLLLCPLPLRGRAQASIGAGELRRLASACCRALALRALRRNTNAHRQASGHGATAAGDTARPPVAATAPSQTHMTKPRQRGHVCHMSNMPPISKHLRHKPRAAARNQWVTLLIPFFPLTPYFWAPPRGTPRSYCACPLVSRPLFRLSDGNSLICQALSLSCCPRPLSRSLWHTDAPESRSIWCTSALRPLHMTMSAPLQSQPLMGIELLISVSSPACLSAVVPRAHHTTPHPPARADTHT